MQKLTFYFIFLFLFSEINISNHQLCSTPNSKNKGLEYYKLMSANKKEKKWQLKLDKDNIQIYTRSAENTKIVEYKAITQFNTSLEHTISILNDVKSYPNWMSDCTKAKTIEMIDINNRFDYIEIHFPWPFADRDLILHYQAKYDRKNQRYFARAEAVTDKLKEKDNIVRIDDAIGSWELTELAKNRTKLIYKFRVDPAGNIPYFVINMFIVNGPYYSLLRIKKRFQTN